MKKRFSKKILTIAIFAIVAIPIVYALNTIDTGFQSNPSTITTIDAPPPPGDVCTKINNTSGKSYFIPTKTASEWTAFKNNLPLLVSLESCVSGYTLDITSNAINYDIAQELINKYALPNPIVTPVTVIVTVFNGVYVYSDSTALPALTTGALSGGSTVTLINKGYIMGRGGDGASVASYYIPELPGKDGGNALNLTIPITIDNGSGYILGGGGGGGGGAGSAGVGYQVGGGGGAGGGRGGDSGEPPIGGPLAGSVGGTPGFPSLAAPVGPSYLYGGTGGGRVPTAGTNPGVCNGSGGCSAHPSTPAGAGGSGGVTNPNPFGFATWSGSGGAYNQAGGNGSDNGDGDAAGGGGGGYGQPGGTESGGYGNGGIGGLGGKAIKTNGNGITWLSSYPSSQVQGAVN